MAAHSKGQKKTGETNSAKLRKEVLKKLEPMSQEWADHMLLSIRAVVPCSYCSINKKDGIVTVMAPKYDDMGQCLKCHGKMVLPDQDQRNWAAKEFKDAVVGNQKVAEDVESDDTGLDDFAKSLEGKTDEEIKKIAESIGLPDATNSL